MKQLAALRQISQKMGHVTVQPHHWAWIRNLLILLLLLSACFSLSKLFWLLMPSPELPEVSPGTPKNILAADPASVGSAGATIDVNAMVAANVFGKATAVAKEPEAPPVVTNIDTAVETSLNLVLKGVMVSTNTRNSSALIASGRSEEFYSVGEKLPVGRSVKLQQVLADRVILDNSGRSESLFLFEKVEGGVSAVAPSRPASFRRPTTAPPKPAVKKPAPVPNSSKPEVSTEDGVETRKIKRIPKSLAEVIRYSFAREQGEIIGIKIRPGRDKQAFADLGLKNNDIVTDINGIELNNSGSIIKVSREMRKATSASVTVLREGQSYSLNLQLDPDV